MSVRIPTKGVYAGSFDPITNGHLWVIQQAAPLFDELVVAVGINPLKRPTFTVERRIELIQKTLELNCCGVTGDFIHATVTSFENKFLVNFAHEINCTHMVRGLRDQDDFRDERRFLNLGLDIQYANHYERIIHTVYFITPPALGETSSGAVKAMCGPEGWRLPVSQMVPRPVFLELEKWVEGGKR